MRHLLGLESRQFALELVDLRLDGRQEVLWRRDLRLDCGLLFGLVGLELGEVGLDRLQLLDLCGQTASRRCRRLCLAFLGLPQRLVDEELSVGGSDITVEVLEPDRDIAPSSPADSAR